MSAVKILIKHKQNGFCDITIDDKMAGTLEDPERVTVTDTIAKILELLEVENVEIREVRI